MNVYNYMVLIWGFSQVAVLLTLKIWQSLKRCDHPDNMNIGLWGMVYRREASWNDMVLDLF